jgi:arylsulfatase
MAERHPPLPPLNEGGENTKRPNLLLLLADDMGYSDIGCFGAEIRTPHLDQLAAGGLVFSQAYNCARCCPSRAALITGLYPHQAGIGHMVQDFGLPGYQGRLSANCVTLAELLGRAGYLTGLTGKWHVGGFWSRNPKHRGLWTFGDPTRPLPTDRGFDRFWGNPAGGGSYFNVMPLVAQDRIIDPPEGFYTTNDYTTAAIRIMEEAAGRGQPFFVHLCYNAPHWPLHALPEDIARYRGQYLKGWDAVRGARHEELKRRGLLDPRWPISARDEQVPAWEDARLREWEDARMAVYAAQVDCMDRNIGRIVARLKELGALDNTLMVFVSDNGGSAEFLAENGRREHEAPVTRDGRPVRIGNIPGLEPGGPDTFMSYGRPWANASNAPFRLFKSWVHEGGISTPLIAHWPQGIRGGVTHEVCHFIDIAATLLEVGGAGYPGEFNGRPVTPLEGESFAPLLAGRPWTRRQPLYFEHEGNAAVRHGRWKVVRRRPGPWELYDMVEDRTELRNLAEADPGRVAELGKLYDAWAARCGVAPWEEVNKRRAQIKA